MFAIIVGGGRVGSYLAKSLVAGGHKVTVVEQDEEVADRLLKRIPGGEIIIGDGCEPDQLELAGAHNADLLAAVTGHDEDNLVLCQLAKYAFKVKRVVARINNPKNEWLFTRRWGVDVAVSAVHIIAKVIEEEASLGEIVTLLKLREGDIYLAELTVAKESKALGKKIRELSLPPDEVLIAAVLRERKIIVPRGDTEIKAGDEILVLTSLENERLVKEALA